MVEVEEEMEQEESSQTVEKMAVEAIQPPEATQEAEESKPPSPKLQLTMSTEDTMDPVDATGVLDASLNPMDTSGIGEEVSAVTEVGMELDLSGLGPDGLVLEGAHNLSQIEDGDNLMGGATMDTSMDPFVVEPTEAAEGK